METNQTPEIVKNEVYYREIKTYQADDGRKIQQVSMGNKIKSSTGIVANFPFDQEKVYNFVGTNVIPSPLGNRLVSFVIPGANNIEEAFDLFDTYYKTAVEEETNKIRSELIQKQKLTESKSQIDTSVENKEVE